MSSLIVNTKESFQSVLDNITYNDTEEFIPNLSYVKVIKVYDGDTITIVFYDNEFKKFKLRLAGIDTPEIKPFLSVENRDIHVQSAKIVKKFVENMILNKIVFKK